MKKFILTLMAAVLMPVLAMAQGCPTPTTATATVTLKRKIPGLLDGNFSVSATKKVAFAQGNLQYRAAAAGTKEDPKWRFAAHQYDRVETKDQNVGTDYADQNVITLFGWGTSGWEGSGSPARVAYMPYSTSGDNGDYGVADPRDASETLTGANANADWGVYNYGDLGSGWRTLTKDEWGYLLGGVTPCRANATSLRKWATVNSVPGLIIMPDGWSGTIADSYDLDAWTTLEGQGAVFLPAAGRRDGTSVLTVGSNGRYWSSSANSATNAYDLNFNSGSVTPQSNNGRSSGYSVRLVHEL